MSKLKRDVAGDVTMKLKKRDARILCRNYKICSRIAWWFRAIEKWLVSQVLTMQENWIGRSEGLEFQFELSKESKLKLERQFSKYSVFTTRPDTIYGVSYSALAPEHPIVKYIVENNLLPEKKIREIKEMQKVSERDRATQEKEGLSLEIDVMHPLTGEKNSCLGSKLCFSILWWRSCYGSSCTWSKDFEFAKNMIYL